jgi:hypothetical protein
VFDGHRRGYNRPPLCLLELVVARLQVVTSALHVNVVTKVLVLLFILGMAHLVMGLLGLISQSLAQLVSFLVELPMPVDVLVKVL